MSREPADRLESTIFKELRGRILRDEVGPGQRLPPERELAAELGTNRNTLREAIRKLESAGLVTVRHGQGTTVTDYRRHATLDMLQPWLAEGSDPEERRRAIEDLLLVRTRLLLLAVELAVDRITPADMPELHRARDALLEAWEVEDALGVALGYQRWIEHLLEAGRSPPVRWMAAPFLEFHQELVQGFPGLSVLDPGLPGHLETFIEALATGDGPRCVESTRLYLEGLDRTLRERLGAIPPTSKGRR